MRRVTFQVNAPAVKAGGAAVLSWPHGKPAETHLDWTVMSGPVSGGSSNSSVSRDIIADGPRLQWVGKHSVESQAAQYVVGVFDEEEATISLLSGDGSVYPLVSNQRDATPAAVAVAEKKHKDLTEEEKAAAERNARYESRKELTEAFGSKKANRGLRKSIAHKVNAEHLEVSNTDIVDALKASKSSHEAAVEEMAEAAEKAASGTGTRPVVPPRVLDAQTPSEVYPIFNVISTDVWKSLKPGAMLDIASDPDYLESMRAESMEYRTHHYLPLYVLDRLDGLRSMEEKSRKKSAKLLLWVSVLLRLYLVESRKTYWPKIIAQGGLCDMVGPWGMEDVAARAVFHDALVKTFFTKMTKPGRDGKMRTEVTMLQEDRDRVLSYALVLMWFMDAFETAMDPVARDLKMSVTALKPYYQELGAWISVKRAKESATGIAGTNITYARLSIPLNTYNGMEKRKRRKSGRD